MLIFLTFYILRTSCTSLRTNNAILSHRMTGVASSVLIQG